MLLVYDKEQVISDFRHTLVILLHIHSLGLKHGSLYARLTQIFDK